MLWWRNFFVGRNDTPDIILDIVEPKVRVKFRNSNWIGCENYSYSIPIQETFSRLLEMLRSSVRGVASLSVLVGLPVWLPNLDILNFCGSGFLVSSCLSKLRQGIAPKLEQTLFNVSQEFDFCLVSIHAREFHMLEQIGDRWLFVRRGYIFLANKKKNVCWFGIGCDTEDLKRYLHENRHYFFDTYLPHTNIDRYSTDLHVKSTQVNETQRNLPKGEDCSSSFVSKVHTTHPKSHDVSVILNNFFVFDPEHLQDSIVEIFKDQAQRLKM